MKIAVVNDVHVGKCLEYNGKVRASSHLVEEMLEGFLQDIIRQHSPDVLINLGDLIRSEEKESDKVINSISESPIDISNSLEAFSLKKDEDLEKDPTATLKKCLQDFFQKGGVLQNISNLSSVTEPHVQINSGDAIYPVCSGGWCRSQALWAILQPYSDRIILFPPHAARVGWDPYNGKINRYRNYAQEIVPDEFSSYFGIEKALRFGFEHTSEWNLIEKLPTDEGLKAISQFYNQYYFGPDSSWQGKRGEKRIYITFSNNTHVAIHRLNQTNGNLKGVTVVAIDSEDLITFPPDFLQTTPRSRKAYEYFSNLLNRLIDLTKCSQEKNLREHYQNNCRIQ